MSTAQLAVTLSSLTKACADVAASEEISTLSDIELVQSAMEVSDSTLPIRVADSARRDFAVNLQTIT
ncbi:unnamed protein product, partial [Strongylus vulgaris]